MNQDFQLFPGQASRVARDVDNLFWYLTTIATFFTILIFVLIVYFAVKFRRRSESYVPPATKTHAKLEILWSVIPFIIVMTIFVWGARVYFLILRPPATALDIHVVGRQWMWKVQHPTGPREINSLHLPAGKPIELTLASQDVIHSLYIPAFRVKMDVLPGRYTQISFTPTKTGEYHLFCAEYCGTLHSGMIGKVVVMQEQEYQDWLARTPSDLAPVDAGASLFQSMACVTCHGSVAPTLHGLYESNVKLTTGETVIADEQYIRESITDSTAKIVDGYKPIMPSFRGQVSEEELMQLVAYIKSLKSDRPGAPSDQNPPLPLRPTPGQEETR